MSLDRYPAPPAAPAHATADEARRPLVDGSVPAPPSQPSRDPSPPVHAVPPVEVGLAAWRSYGLLLAERVDALEARVAALEAGRDVGHDAATAPAPASRERSASPATSSSPTRWHGLAAAVRSVVGEPAAPSEGSADPTVADPVSIDAPDATERRRNPQHERTVAEVDAIVRPDPTAGFWDELLGVRRPRRD